ncbi:MAG: hypothetical protein ACO3NL_09075, partial [Phycisphaerales bacterium]
MPPTPRVSVTNSKRVPFHAKITGHDEICRCVSTTRWMPGPRSSSLCRTPSGQSIESHSRLGAPASPKSTGSSGWPLAPPRHGNAVRDCQAPTVRASPRVPRPLSLVRICCEGSVRPLNQIAAKPMRPGPASRQRGAPSASPRSLTAPRASGTASEAIAGRGPTDSTRLPRASRISKATEPSPSGRESRRFVRPLPARSIAERANAPGVAAASLAISTRLTTPDSIAQIASSRASASPEIAASIGPPESSSRNQPASTGFV